MFLLDADIIVWASRRKEKIIEELKKLIGEEIVGVSTITIAEIYAGIRPLEMAEMTEFFNKLAIIEVKREIAEQAGLLWQDHKMKFKNLSLADCIVAATAKDQNAILVTLNTKHFPMSDIKILNPLRS